MVERDHPEISLSRQCWLLGISRGSFYYEPKGESDGSLVPVGIPSCGIR